jgi:rRNA maturation RNase YbeY
MPRPGTALGDVVISVDTARRQARRLGVAPATRMRTLLMHGVLHLLGYDHERSPAEARRMFARERELAAALEGAASARSRRRRKSARGDSKR